MSVLCYVPFHLTAPFHTIPCGPESGDLLVHVTVIIFFNRDKDMDSRDSAYSLSSPAPTLILFGDSVSVLDRNEFIQSRIPYCVQRHSYAHSHIVCVHQKYIHTSSRKYSTYAHLCTQEPGGIKTEQWGNSRQMFSLTVFDLIIWTKEGLRFFFPLALYSCCFFFRLSTYACFSSQIRSDRKSRFTGDMLK